MKKEDLLREIANQGYNAGFGAKVSFASFDMLRFLPGFISFSSTALGVLGLVFDTLSTKAVSAGGACPKVCVSGIWLCFGLGLFF
jgi:hypothetical protein